MAHGTVKWFNPDKGYGFIDPDDGEPEIFVHYSGIQGRGYRSLEAGQRVEYRTMPGARGPQATAVRPEGTPEALDPERRSREAAAGQRRTRR